MNGNRHPTRWGGIGALAVSLWLGVLLRPAPGEPDSTPAEASPGSEVIRPDAATVADLRRQMQELQGERDRRERERIFFFTASTRRPQARMENGCGAVCLVNEMRGLRTIWTFTPVSDSAADAGRVRVPLCHPGEQWLTLPAGRWRATLLAGDAEGQREIRLEAGELRVESGRRYECMLTRDCEGRLQERLQAWNPAPRERSQPEPGAAAPTMRRTE